nr:MAG TPA: YopX protein [Caudoviricetes sp.]
MIPKFRMWNRITSQLHLVDGLYFDDKEAEYVDDDNVLRFIGFKNIELMQSTGLKDKNGKEIFEGDVLEIQGIKMIVKFGSYKYLETSKNNGHILGILHDGLGFYVECINAADPDNISPFEPETLKNSQIIGNIYENREILMGK